MADVKEVVEDGERSLQWRTSYTDPRYPGGQYPGGTLRREGTLDKRSEQYGPGRIIQPHDKDYGTNNRNHIYESPQFSWGLSGFFYGQWTYVRAAVMGVWIE